MSGPGADCTGSVLVRVQVNGQAGFAQYRDGGRTPWSIQLPVVTDGRITQLTHFLETDGSLFRLFGLPARHPAREHAPRRPGECRPAPA